jgi:hypothetical protein
MPNASIFAVRKSTWICFLCPPRMSTVATPSTRSKRYCTWSSRICWISWISLSCTVMPSIIIGIAATSNLRIIGLSTSSGSTPKIRSIRSRISLTALSKFTPHGKVTRTWLRPSWEVEVTSSMPWIPARAASIGRVTSSSTSCGPAFEKVVITLIVGIVISGIRSMGKRDKENEPISIIIRYITVIKIGRLTGSEINECSLSFIF